MVPFLGSKLIGYLQVVPRVSIQIGASYYVWIGVRAEKRSLREQNNEKINKPEQNIPNGVSKLLKGNGTLRKTHDCLPKARKHTDAKHTHSDDRHYNLPPLPPLPLVPLPAPPPVLTSGMLPERNLDVFVASIAASTATVDAERLNFCGIPNSLVRFPSAPALGWPIVSGPSCLPATPTALPAADAASSPVTAIAGAGVGSFPSAAFPESEYKTPAYGDHHH